MKINPNWFYVHVYTEKRANVKGFISYNLADKYAIEQWERPNVYRVKILSGTGKTLYAWQ